MNSKQDCVQTDILEMKYNFVVYMANLVEAKDPNLGNHIDRTAQIAYHIGNELLKRGLYPETVNREYVEALRLAAPLHDIGKIRIPDTILLKPGKLTEEEYEEVKKHATYGREIVEEAFGECEGDKHIAIAREIAKYHHEKYDGTGYPEGLSGEKIPLSARIMAVADVYDALSGKRCYKEAFPQEEVYEIMNEDAGVQFDPVVLGAFMGICDEINNLK